MADQFEAGLCGESWWNYNNSSRTMFGTPSSCSSAINDMRSLLDDYISSSSSAINTDYWNHDLQLRGSGKAENNNNNSCQTILLVQEEDNMNSGLTNYLSGNNNNNNNNNDNFCTTTGNQDCSSSSVHQQQEEVVDQIISLSSSSSSLLLQTLLDTDLPRHQQQPCTSLLPKFSSCCCLPQQEEQPLSHMQFPRNINASFWNHQDRASSIPARNNDIPPSFLPSTQPPDELLASAFVNTSNPGSKVMSNEEVQDFGKKIASNDELIFKRPRIETPSPLPTFKVRKEKLGDRVTALQQLVSPFGKTDTASVLHEAIEYIKFLHDQVNVLSTPYMKNNGTNLVQRHKIIIPEEHKKEEEGRKQQDLISRGLCLVPISSTFPVAAETATTSDFWTPTFGVGGAFK